jgi:hypothetical protein
MQDVNRLKLVLIEQKKGGIRDVLAWQATKGRANNIVEALAFCKKNNLNTDYAVFVDFSKHSGRERYMIYSFSKHEVVYRCLCASGLNKNAFSNQPGSNLSSLGKYRITNEIHNMSIGREGLVVDGLGSSNSNARSRKILIHYSMVLNDFPKRKGNRE